MNIEAMKEEIKKEEGYSNKVYFDILGYGTIGYGHLVRPLVNFKEGKIEKYYLAITKNKPKKSEDTLIPQSHDDWL